MGIVSWLILGAIAGSLANFIDPHPSRGGILGSIVLGIVGAIVGGWIGGALLGLDVTGVNVMSILVAIGGSLLLLWLGRMFMRRA
jgi:uncharacterized membrane protein YeaQ/YmgE (transglycosylase-associated protein family)